MIIRRIIRSQRHCTFLRSENPPKIPSAGSSLVHPPISFKPFSASAQFPPQNTVEKTPNKPLSIYFKEAMGILGKSPETHTEETGEYGKLNKLEGEMRLLEKNLGNTKKQMLRVAPLSSLFVNKASSRETSKEKKESNSEFKPLSPDMQAFVMFLYEKGYFKDCTALPRNTFDITCFGNGYAKDYVRFAAEQFGRDNREIAKWVSGSDLKKVAYFGCPSLSKKIVFSAKGLRRFFGIQESTVCDKCVLKQSCKFVNENGRKGDTKNLDLPVVMRVVPLYVMDSVHPQLVVPQEIKDSASRLLKEAVNLSRTIT